MARNDYDSSDELFADLEMDLIDIMSGEVDEVAKEVYENQVDYMYEEYDRTYYNPRYKNNGFADRDNWKSEVKKIGDIVEYSMENTTLANGDNKGERLDKYIEEGRYNWRKYPGKRPIYSRTQEILDGTSHVEMAIDDGLSKRGWK